MERSLICSKDLDNVITWHEEAWGLSNVDLENNGES